MSRFSSLVLILILLTGHAGAFDEKASAAKDLLIAAIQAEDEAKALPGSSSGRSGTAYIRSLDQAFRQGSRQEMEYPLGQIADSYRSPKVQAAISDLQNSLTAYAQQAEKSEIAALQTLKAEATELLKKAEKPAELDALINKLSEVTGKSSGRRSQELSAVYEEVIQAKKYVRQWQDYLQARINSRSKANELLRNLAASDGYQPIPRSRLIALIDADTEPTAGGDMGIGEVVELDQLAPALRKFRLNQSRRVSGEYNQRDTETETMVRSLTQIDSLYQSHKAGLPVSPASVIGYVDTALSSNDELSARLRAKLLAMILPRAVGAPEQTAAKPDEKPMDLIERIIREASECEDLPACIRALEVRHSLAPTTRLNEAPPVPLVRCRSGLAQETAGQILQAVVSYQSTLAAGCDPTLAKLIGKRLDAIQKAHPDEYKQAVEKLPLLQN